MFNDFLALHTALVEAQGIGIASVFPPTHSKSSIGFGLTEDQHAERYLFRTFPFPHYIEPDC